MYSKTADIPNANRGKNTKKNHTRPTKRNARTYLQLPNLQGDEQTKRDNKKIKEIYHESGRTELDE